MLTNPSPFQIASLHPASYLPAAGKALPDVLPQAGGAPFAQLLAGLGELGEGAPAGLAELDLAGDDPSLASPSPPDEAAPSPEQGFILAGVGIQPPNASMSSASAATETIAPLSAVGVGGAPLPARLAQAALLPVSARLPAQARLGAEAAGEIVPQTSPAELSMRQHVEAATALGRPAAPLQQLQPQAAAPAMQAGPDRSKPMFSQLVVSIENDPAAPDTPAQLQPSTLVAISRSGDEAVTRSSASVFPPPISAALPAAGHIVQRFATEPLAMREQGPRLTLTHQQFGPVALSLGAVTDGAITLTLTAADPEFLPTIQAALGERIENGRASLERSPLQDQPNHKVPGQATAESGSFHNGSASSGANPQAPQQHKAAARHLIAPERTQQSSPQAGSFLQPEPERGQRFA